MSLLTIPANDQSVYYLGQLFGNVGSVLTTSTGSMLLAAMFKTLNTVVLAVGGILVIYTIIVGLLKTAAEGEFLGEKWDSIWVPFRMVMGIAIVYPTASGYSNIQIIMMWIIMQGIGAADALWISVLDFVQVAGSPYAGVGMPPTPDVSQNMQSLFQAIVCETAAKGRDLTQGNGDLFVDTYSRFGATTNRDSTIINNLHYYYYCADVPNHGNESFCVDPNAKLTLVDPMNNNTSSQWQPCAKNGSKVTCSIGPGWSKPGDPGFCGSITYSNDSANCATNSTSVQCLSSKAQTQALQAIVASLQTIAAQFVKYDHDYLAFTQNTSIVPPLNYPPPAPQQGMPTNNWQVPMEILNYCNSNIPNITPCCVYGTQPLGVAGICESYGNQSPNFPLPYNTNTSPIDFGNQSNAAITTILWPFAMQPYISGGGSAGGSSAAGSVDFLLTQAQFYSGFISQANQAAVLAAASLTQLTGNSATQASLGWMMAGAYYYTLASMNNNNLTASLPTFSVAGNDPHLAADQSDKTSLSRYRNDYDAAGFIEQIIIQQTGGGSQAQVSPEYSEMSNGMNGAASGIMGSFMKTVSGSNGSGAATNPLVALQSLGEKFLIIGQVLYPAFLAIIIVLLIAGKLNTLELGFGLVENPVEPMIAFLGLAFWALLMAFLGWLFAFGAILAVYTPLIPYIIFTLGAVGWLTATIEAMIASPFIALGILFPGGQHEILGHAHHAVMIIFNTFLRPSLMIMGMMAGMLLAPVVVSLINAGFSAVMGTIMPNPGIIEIIFFVSVYVMLVMTAIAKCFALIHQVPAKALTWLSGGQAMSYGEEEGMREIQKGQEAVSSAVAEGTKSSIKAVQELGQKIAKARAQAETADASMGAADQATVNDPKSSPAAKASAQNRMDLRKAESAATATIADPASSAADRATATTRLAAVRQARKNEFALENATAADEKIANDPASSAPVASAAKARIGETEKKFLKNLKDRGPI